MAQQPRYSVDATKVIEKLKERIGTLASDHAMAEAAVDELLAREERLVGELKQVQSEKDNMQAEMDKIREELDNLKDSM